MLRRDCLQSQQFQYCPNSPSAQLLMLDLASLKFPLGKETQRIMLKHVNCAG
jgi:hypothetical protein